MERVQRYAFVRMGIELRLKGSERVRNQFIIGRCFSWPH